MVGREVPHHRRALGPELGREGEWVGLVGEVLAIAGPEAELV